MKSIRGKIIGLCLLGLSWLCMGLPLAHAHFQVPDTVWGNQTKPHALNERIYRRVERINTRLEQKDYTDAYRRLSELASDYHYDAYIVSLAMRMAAYAYLEQEDYPRGIQWLEGLLKLRVLDASSLSQAERDLAQLFLVTDQYKKASRAWSEWIRRNPKKVKTQDYYYLSYAYVQQELWAQALRSLKQANKKPGRQWKDIQALMLKCHLNLKQYSQAVALLKGLIGTQPDSEKYWLQLIHLYDELEQPSLALASMRTLHLQGGLPKRYFKSYIQRLMHLGNVKEAARLMDSFLSSGMIEDTDEHRALNVQLWALAGEQLKALEGMHRQLEKDPDNRQIAVRLSQMLARQLKWKESILILEDALKSEPLANEASNYLQLAIFYYEASEYSKSRDILQRLSQEQGIDDKVRQSAGNWLAYVKGIGQFPD